VRERERKSKIKCVFDGGCAIGGRLWDGKKKKNPMKQNAHRKLLELTCVDGREGEWKREVGVKKEGEYIGTFFGLALFVFVCIASPGFSVCPFVCLSLCLFFPPEFLPRSSSWPSASVTSTATGSTLRTFETFSTSPFKR
jgi:hypothetical protein